MKEPTPTAVWEALGCLATTICSEIETESPAVVVVLHRSGAVVWHAVRTLWAAPRTQPLPPAIDILVGQDTAGTCADEVLRDRLQAALGETPPATLLVVDDVVHHGYTAITALCLIWSVLPQADACLYAGMPASWREILGRHWLQTFHPAVADQMAANWERDKVALFGASAERARPGFCWPPLISGLARGEEPLSSIPLAAALPYPEYLTCYMAPAQWLEFAAWAYATVTTEMGVFLTAQAAAPLPPAVTSWQPRRYVLNSVELVWAQAWLREWSTLDEFAEHCRASLADLAQIVAALVAEGEFVCRTVDGAVQYGRKLQRAIVTADAWFGRYWDWLGHEVLDELPVVTPFAVEYARASATQAGAPMLIPIAGDQGAPVCGRMLLYGADVDRLGMPESIYACCSKEDDAGATVECIKEFAGVTEVFTIRHTASLDFVVDPTIPKSEKGRRLAELAVASLTQATVAQGMDGIQYLITALARGVETRLTPDYRDALLQLAGGAPDLSAARRRLLAAKGLADPALLDTQQQAQAAA